MNFKQISNRPGTCILQDSDSTVLGEIWEEDYIPEIIRRWNAVEDLEEQIEQLKDELEDKKATIRELRDDLASLNDDGEEDPYL